MVCQGRTYLPILIYYWVNILFQSHFTKHMFNGIHFPMFLHQLSLTEIEIQ